MNAESLTLEIIIQVHQIVIAAIAALVILTIVRWNKDL